VNGLRLLTKANIEARIAEIRSEAAWNSLPVLRRVIAEAERRAVESIQSGSLKQECRAAESFAKMVINLDSASSRN
jgi:hypothetical protein